MLPGASRGTSPATPWFQPRGTMSDFCPPDRERIHCAALSHSVGIGSNRHRTLSHPPPPFPLLSETVNTSQGAGLWDADSVTALFSDQRVLAKTYCPQLCSGRRTLQRLSSCVMFRCLELELLPVYQVPVPCQTGQDSQGSSEAARSPQLYCHLPEYFWNPLKHPYFILLGVLNGTNFFKKILY